MPTARIVLVAVVTAFASIGCGGAKTKPGEVVFSSDGVASHEGERVRVRGLYALYDATKHGKDEPAVYDGHAAIILEDGTRVLLEPINSPAAIRPEEEIARFAGRMVFATGVLTKLPPPDPNQPQDLVTPCLSNVEEVRLVPP